MTKDRMWEMVEKFALIFVVVGSLNWGVIGLTGVNLVQLFVGKAGQMLVTLTYIVVGVSGLYTLVRVVQGKLK